MFCKARPLASVKTEGKNGLITGGVENQNKKEWYEDKGMHSTYGYLDSSITTNHKSDEQRGVLGSLATVNGLPITV